MRYFLRSRYNWPETSILLFKEDKLLISSIPIRFDQKNNFKEVIADFLINGYLTSNKTILKDVFSLEPGHF